MTFLFPWVKDKLRSLRFTLEKEVVETFKNKINYNQKIGDNIFHNGFHGYKNAIINKCFL